jgi:uncharacterized protein (DUF1499 family)
MMGRVRGIITMSILSSILAGCAGERPSLGVRDGRLTVCPGSPNCVSSQAADQHHIAPLEFSDAPDAAFARLRQILSSRRDTKLLEDKPHYLRVEFHTVLFVDDGEFLLAPEQGVIQIRSASRLGYSDFGKNRRRIEEIRADFARQ